MSLQMKIHKEVELQIDAMYSKTEQLGELAVKVFGRGRGKTQLRNLENIANSTLKVSDVLDYIKRQTARLNEWKKQGFGVKMLEYIQKDILNMRKTVFTHLSSELEHLNDRDRELKKQEIAVQLIRGFVKQLVIHFEWALATGK